MATPPRKHPPPIHFLKCCDFRYRLRRSNTSGESAWSVIITVNTTRKPKTSEDLIKAVNQKDLAKVDALLEGNFCCVYNSHNITHLNNRLQQIKEF